MTSQTHRTLTDADLELVVGGRTAPDASARTGAASDHGDVAVNEEPGGTGDPQSIF